MQLLTNLEAILDHKTMPLELSNSTLREAIDEITTLRFKLREEEIKTFNLTRKLDNAQEHKQKRYYLFRHTGLGETLQYLAKDTPPTDLTWTTDHDHMTLISQKDLLIALAKRPENASTFDGKADWIYVIGTADAIFSGFAPLEVIDNNTNHD
jgi:hypothetical protein